MYPPECRKNENAKIWWNYIVDVSFAVSMNLFLLLPTGLSILGNKKDTGDSTSLLKILGSEPHTGQHPIQSLRLGLTLFRLLALCFLVTTGLKVKTRKLAIDR